MYQPHPSIQLTEHFRRRPFQGTIPEEATFLFIGLDANYAPDVENSPSFGSILDYHADGVAFWQRHGVHHPFLLPSYRGDGKRYHTTFARIGFGPEHASLVSFAELLHVPTVGRSSLETRDLDASHLERLNNAITKAHARHIFLSAGVLRLMQATRSFSWLPKRGGVSRPLQILYDDGYRKVYQHLHFSNYGKFQQQLDTEAEGISSLIRELD